MGGTRDGFTQNLEQRLSWDVAHPDDLRVRVVFTLIMLALATVYC